MDILQKLGGRKFIMAIIAIGAGMYLEMMTPHGLSVNMTGLLVGLVGAFSAANYMATAKHFDFKAGGNDDNDSSEGIKQLSNQVTDLTNLARSMADPQATQNLLQVLQNVNQALTQVQQVSGQIGVGVVGLSKEVSAIKRAVSQPTF